MSLLSGAFPLFSLPCLDSVGQVRLHSTLLVLQVAVSTYAIVSNPQKWDKDREYLLVGWSVNHSGFFLAALTFQI
jgi:hypothetical protein